MGSYMTVAWFHWPCHANEVRFIEVWTVIVRWCLEPTSWNRKYFE